MEVVAEDIQVAKYDAYKDSGEDWMAEIPEHWEVKPGFTIIEERNEKNVGLIENTVLSLSYGNVIVKPEEKLTGLVPESFETYQLVYPGDIIIRPTDLQNDKNSLRTGLAKNNGIITSAYINLKVKHGYSHAYFHYFLHTIDITKVIYGLGTGLRQNLGFNEFKRFSFLLPPKEEQAAIAKFLDRKTAQIDKAIGIKEKQIELLKERRQLLIHKAVTRGLNPDAPMKDSGVEWIGEIPAHWEVRRVKHLGRIINGYAFNSVEFKSEGVRVMKISNIQTMRVDWADESFIDEKYYNKLPQFRVNQDDLAFALTRPIISTGIKAAIVSTDEKVLLNQRNAVLRPTEKVGNRWLYYIILDSEFVQTFDNEIDKTGQQPNISTISIGNLRIPFTSLKEQKAIVRYLDEVTSKVSITISLKEKEIEKLKEYKASLINSAVTGKIKVC